MSTDTGTERRSVERRLRIAAPVEAVWSALTEADQLTRWFPLTAEVEPGEDGHVAWEWPGHDSCYRWELQVAHWEPPHRLRLTYRDEGRHRTEEHEPLAVEFRLRGDGGETELRMVHSGFGPDADWDDEYHGVRRGWAFELQSLRHFLETHPGEPRRVVHALAAIRREPEAVWESLAAALGLEGGTEDGAACSLRLPDASTAHGQAITVDVPWQFACTVRELDDALFRFHIQPAPAGAQAWLWVSAWSVDDDRLAALRDGFSRLLQELDAKASVRAMLA